MNSRIKRRNRLYPKDSNGNVTTVGNYHITSIKHGEYGKLPTSKDNQSLADRRYIMLVKQFRNNCLGRWNNYCGSCHNIIKKSIARMKFLSKQHI